MVAGAQLSSDDKATLEVTPADESPLRNSIPDLVLPRCSAQTMPTIIIRIKSSTTHAFRRTFRSGTRPIPCPVPLLELIGSEPIHDHVADSEILPPY